ncbi:MAG TPA: hypothetical protein PLY87_24445 [Planctomycetaceae bacterium]|nr:hypothetical protein [Planctomycetaceae bacterium]HQZ68271.1 hypothetical protein [Planctomycetaceae bacterium]
MITIENLEVRFDVEGDDDRKSFARLFNEFIRNWAAAAEERRLRERQSSQTRDLGFGTGEH